MATENRRQILLREMGIQCWFPNSALPGAGPSHDIALLADWQDQPETAGAAAQALPVAQRPQRRQTEPGQSTRSDQIPPALREALASGSDKAADTAADTAPVSDMLAGVVEPAVQTDIVPAAEDGQTLEFAFSWFNVDQRLSVLAMLPPGAERLTGACGQMLQRILVALSPGFQDLRTQEHTFHWPFSDDLGLPTGQMAARQAVDGFVARRLREQPSAMLLVLADDTPPFLYGDAAAGGDDQTGRLFVHRQFGFAMLRTHSLHAMEANSELKRSAWQAMQPLRDRLNRGVE